MKRMFEQRSEEHDVKMFETLESIQGPFGDDDKVDLLLTVIGEKPACFLEFGRPTRDDKTTQEVEDVKDSIQIFCEQNALVCDEIRHESDNWTDVVLCIGKDKEIVLDLEHSDIQERGRVLGFPDSAVSVFKKDELLMSEEELPREVKESDYIKFLNFRLSRDHWQEELESVRHRAEMVRTHFPGLYDRIVGS